MRAVLALVAACCSVLSALANDKPEARDVAAMEKCIKAKTGRAWAWETCIGVVSSPAQKMETACRPRKSLPATNASG